MRPPLLARCSVVGLDSGAKGLAVCDEKGRRHRGERCSVEICGRHGTARGPEIATTRLSLRPSFQTSLYYLHLSMLVDIDATATV